MIFATIISDSQTRAKKTRTMNLFFVRYRVNVTKINVNGEKRFRKKKPGQRKMYVEN
jgi:hypothetical protein